MRLNIEIPSMGSNIKAMSNRSSNIKKAIPIILKKSLFIIEEKTKRESPVRTGRMRASITEGKELFQTYATIGPTVHYAKYVEMGTVFMQPNPFMQRGIEEAVNPIKEMVDNEISKAIQ